MDKNQLTNTLVTACKFMMNSACFKGSHLTIIIKKKLTLSKMLRKDGHICRLIYLSHSLNFSLTSKKRHSPLKMNHSPHL